MMALIRLLVLTGGLAAVSAFGSRPPLAEGRHDLASLAPPPVEVAPDIAAFYRENAHRPLWVDGRRLRPEVRRLLAVVGADPPIDAALARAAGGDPVSLAQAELLLTRKLVAHVVKADRPPRTATLRLVDEELAPRPRSTGEMLGRLARSANRAEALERLLRPNPVVAGLERGLRLYRSRWSGLPQARIATGAEGRPLAQRLRHRLGLAPEASETALAERLLAFQRVHGLDPTGLADRATLAALDRGAGHYEKIILANLERARALPRGDADRWLLVDTGSARLWTVDEGRLGRSMKVVVGRQGMATPAMAGLLRHAILNPYWNLPPDLIRERARRVLRRGPRVLTEEKMEIWSDWSPSARRLDPRRVDWKQVASGRNYVNLRQKPGPHNMMGSVKFMMPNELGIYLHDTPRRDHFARTDRRISSGCVRLEQAWVLGRWLFDGRLPKASGEPEQQIDLPEPVPVFIAYFTALPTRGGIVFTGDPYRRDAALLASLDPGPLRAASAPRP